MSQIKDEMFLKLFDWGVDTWRASARVQAQVCREETHHQRAEESDATPRQTAEPERMRYREGKPCTYTFPCDGPERATNSAEIAPKQELLICQVPAQTDDERTERGKGLRSARTSALDRDFPWPLSIVSATRHDCGEVEHESPRHQEACSGLPDVGKETVEMG